MTSKWKATVASIVSLLQDCSRNLFSTFYSTSPTVCDTLLIFTFYPFWVVTGAQQLLNQMVLWSAKGCRREGAELWMWLHAFLFELSLTCLFALLFDSFSSEVLIYRLRLLGGVVQFEYNMHMNCWHGRTGEMSVGEEDEGSKSALYSVHNCKEFHYQWKAKKVCWSRGN